MKNWRQYRGDERRQQVSDYPRLVRRQRDNYPKGSMDKEVEHTTNASASSRTNGRMVGGHDTAGASVGNGINALLALSEQVSPVFSFHIVSFKKNRLGHCPVPRELFEYN